MSCFLMKPDIGSCSVRVLAAIVIVVQATISLNSAALDEEEVSSLSLAVDFTACLVENVSKFRSKKDKGFSRKTWSIITFVVKQGPKHSLQS